MQIRTLPAPALPPPKTSRSALQSAPAEGVDPVRRGLIESMIRVVPDEASREQLVQALRWMPTEALARVAEYGTRLEVYDKNAEGLPLYARLLAKDSNRAGCYSPTANVIFVDQKNITPLVLLHEFGHALDRALNDPSQSASWQEARDRSRATRVCIRPYATHNSAEYFADNLAAHLIPDGELRGLLHGDWDKGINTAGHTRESFIYNHVNYSHGRQAKADEAAYHLVKELLQRLPSMPAAAPRPALSPEQYFEEIRRRKKA